MKYLVKTPWWLRAFYPKLTWRMPGRDHTVYLTFDDGPTPEVTPWVLEQLEKYGFSATFFLIGQNVEEQPKILKALQESPHSLGSHTYSHVNGWQTAGSEYWEEFQKGHRLVGTDLFRPPYGRITRAQARQIGQTHRIIMWDIISADFDTQLSGEECTAHVTRHLRPGSIVVFHDSHKAWPRLKVALPKVLAFMKEKGYRSEGL